MASVVAGFHALALVLFVSVSAMAAPPLKVGYYLRTCPLAENIIKQTVFNAVSRNPGMAAGLVRLHFHDCFVRGCDASVLLKSTPGNPAERDHPANNPSLRGFEIIDQAKARLEALCPGTVSCADIVAFAARDSAQFASRNSALFTGGIIYDVPAGRRDGRVSRLPEVTQNLPPPSFNAQQLIANFARKGLSVDEMVTLSGAHSIGISHCSSFSSRLYAFNATHAQDPTLDRAYAAFLKTKCPPPSNKTQPDPTVPLDSITANTLDNKYYIQLLQRRGLLTSDETLYTSPSTSGLVVNNTRNGYTWSWKFAKAMVKMGSIEVLTGNQGEIRKVCSVVN
ncbi:peroxidase 5 [Eucalyptus grandis]|uniref:Peroxidase n=1 Tax=Eucalyptus globulus TaxID=34317 RepID=A0ABD3JGW9_EUCGL|nr:peroxidase 5 [Eucalyptus grandis]